MKHVTKILICFFILVLNTHANAQRHQWAESFDIANKSVIQIYAIGNDSFGNSYVTGESASDSFTYKNKLYVSNNNSRRNNFVSKIDKNGNLIWENTIHVVNGQYNFLEIVDIIYSKNKIYVFGMFKSDKVFFGKNDTLYSSNPNDIKFNTLFIAEYDTSGNVLKTTKVAEGNSNFISNKNNRCLIADSYGDVFCLFESYKNTDIIFDKNGHINSASTQNSRVEIILKYSSDIDSIIWIKQIPANYLFIGRISAGDDNNIYAVASTRGLKTELNGKTYNFTYPFSKGFLIILSGKNGNFIYSDLINSDTTQQDNAQDITAIDTNNIFIVGEVQDSILNHNKWFTSLNKNSTGTSRPFIGNFSTTKSPKFITMSSEKGSNNVSNNSFTGFYMLINKDEEQHIYSVFSTNMVDSVLTMGGLSVSVPKKGSLSSAGFVKLDSLGNALWLRNLGIFTNSTFDVNDMYTDINNSLVYCGDYGGKVMFSPYTLFPIDSTVGAGYIAKVMDYYIVRDSVFPGPYCAGDSILIPFTKYGIYDTSNYFVAEISDAFGDFNGKEIELGRLKTDTAGTVKGILPLLEVASSAKYRIRIRSTSPVVQSFYKRDSLRLLIYSKDTANAGIDRTICKGYSVELKTFGGTQWQWTPGNLTKDSSFWKTFAYPDSTTEFRVIIRDSSGCGVTDTDYVVINVRPKLEIKTPFYDTAICENQSIEFTANTFGGDTTNHVVNWFELRKDSLIKLDSNTKKITVKCDSFCKANTEIRDTGKVILAILWDSCTVKRDTQIYYLNATKDLDVKVFSDKQKTITFKDTVLCLGQTITLYPKGLGGNSSSYSYEWWVGGFEFSNADSVEITPKNNDEYFVVLKDNCSPKNDTAFFKININPPLNSEIINQNNKAKLPKDTSICFGQKIKFGSKNSGGDSMNYSFQWSVDGVKFSNSDTFSYTFLEENTSQKIQLILTDNCTIKSDTSKIDIYTKSKLKIEATLKDTFCLNENYIIKTQASGGDSTKYSFQFSVGGLQFSNADTGILPTNISGNHQLKIVLKDGCTQPNDSLIKDYFVRDSLKITANILDTFCSGNTINASSLANGGNKNQYIFEWSVNRNVVSNTQNISYLIQPNEAGKLNEIKVKISDNCSETNDSFVKQIFVTNPLQISLSIDSNCINNKAKIIANASGGKQSQYQFEWFVNDFFKENNSTGILNFADNKDAKIKVKISDNCSQNNDSAEIILQALIPKISAEINPTDECEPLEVTLKITNENGTKNSYNWSVGNGEILNINSENETYTYQNSGTFIGNIKAKTNNNCETDLVLEKVFVRPLPIVDFTWNPTDISLSGADVDFTNLGNQNDQFNWQINDSNFSKDFNTKYIFNDSGYFTIKLIAETEFHCMDSSIKKLFVKDLVSVYIPNVFTPNGDGLNDEFTPIVTGIESYELQIFNRWGQQIFDGNQTHHWNGKYNKTNVSDGSYIYQIRLLRNDKKVVYLNGVLNVLR